MALLDILKKKKTKNHISEKQDASFVAPLGKKEPPRNTQKRKTDGAPQKSSVRENAKENIEQYSRIIVRPRITEKASMQSGGNSYTFDVLRGANKIQIKKAIKEIYGVLPAKVNIVYMKPKRKVVRNTAGSAASFKKAIVFLKDGDTIEFI